MRSVEDAPLRVCPSELQQQHPPTLPPLRAHFVVEDEGAEHQDPLSHPFHRLLPAYRSRRLRRTRVGQ